MIELLHANVGDHRFGRAIDAAIELLSSAEVRREDGPNTLLQSSKSVADLHSFRKRSGYYKPGAAIGLDETIEALAAQDVPVRLGAIETDRGYIGIWVDEHDKLLGVMVFTTKQEVSTETFIQ